MEDETASVLFAEIVKFLENLPDGVGQTRLCSLLSRSDLADLIRLRKAAGIVQVRDIRTVVASNCIGKVNAEVAGESVLAVRRCV